MADITGRYVKVQGCNTYYETAGSKQPVIFLAPAGRDTSHWHHFLTYYGQTYQTIALDLPGRGKSGLHPDFDYLREPDAIVEFIAEFAATLGVGSFAVVGCSLGGSLAYAIACRSEVDIAAVVAFEGTDYSPVVSEDTLLMLEHPRVNHVQYLIDNVLGLTGSSAPDVALDFLSNSLPNVNALALQADLEAYGKIDLRSAISAITCPVLSIRGTDDWIVSDQQIQATLSRLRNASVVYHHDLSGVGHWPHIEAPRESMELIDDFLHQHY